MQSIAPKQPQRDNPNDWDQFKDMSEFMFNPVSKSVAFIEFLGTFIFNILRMACVPAEIIFRRNFGERHFNLYLYIGGTLWLGIFATGWLNIPAGMGFRGEGIVPNAVIFSLIALVFYSKMFWYLFLMKNKDIDARLYTRYDGDPLTLLQRLPLAKDNNGNVREYRVRQFYEPLTMFSLGVIIAVLVNPQTGTWLILSSFCMAIKEYVQARHTRNLLLDQIDAEIIGRNMAAALKGEAPNNTQGVYIAGISNEGKDRDVLNDLVQKKQQRFTAQASQ